MNEFELNTLYSEDPILMIKDIRNSTLSKVRLDEDRLSSIKLNADKISLVPIHVVTHELNSIIMSEVPSIGFILLDKTSLLPIIFPQLALLKGVEIQDGKYHKDNFYHTLEVLDNVAKVSDNLWLRWAALLHDIAKPQTKKFDKEFGWTFHGHEVKGSKMVHKIFNQFKLPSDERMKYVEKLVLLHLRPIVLAQVIVTDSAVRRLLFDAGNDLDDLMILCDADITSKNEEKKQRFRENYQLVRKKLKDLEERDHIRTWQPPINGFMIMEAFGLTEGDEIGEIKSAIKDAILDGSVENSFEAAYEFMKDLGNQRGLKLVKELSKPE